MERPRLDSLTVCSRILDICVIEWNILHALGSEILTVKVLNICHIYFKVNWRHHHLLGLHDGALAEGNLTARGLMLKPYKHMN